VPEILTLINQDFYDGDYELPILMTKSSFFDREYGGSYY